MDRDAKTERRIVQAVQQNKCLECRDNPIHKRGLCVKCASRYEHRLRTLPNKTAKRKYMLERMKQGLLLDAQEIRVIKVTLCDPAYRAAVSEAS